MKAASLAQIAVELETNAKDYNLISITDNALDGITVSLERRDGCHNMQISFDLVSELRSELEKQAIPTI
ncbi:hypothetical protein VPHD254_0207 [Vibrio phage D254]